MHDIDKILVSNTILKKPDKLTKEAFEIIKRESGTHFDPKLVEIFLNHKEEFLNILNKN